MNLTTMKKTKNGIILGLFLLVSAITTSCGDGSDGRNIQIPGVDGPTVTLNQDNVLIAMVFENIQLDGGLRYPVPKYPNSYIEVSPHLQSGGTMMAVSISLDDVFNGDLQRLDPQALPGGRPLPGVPSGSLPAIAFSIEKFYGMGFYIGESVFGLFVPIKGLGIGNSVVTARFYSSGSRVGNISLVGEDTNGENSGILLMLDLGKYKSKLKKLAKRY
jgi:hypothetical protein